LFVGQILKLNVHFIVIGGSTGFDIHFENLRLILSAFGKAWVLW
jgi:hypothetical protein